MNRALATPPPDVFWSVGSCILFQLDFPLQAEESQFRDNAGGEVVFEASRTRTAENLGLQNEMLTWKTSQLEFLLERAWSSPKSGKIVTEACKIRTPCERAEIGRLSRPYGQNRRIVLNLAAMSNIEELYRGFPARMKACCIME
jgi:hypothetical protein